VEESEGFLNHIEIVGHNTAVIYGNIIRTNVDGFGMDLAESFGAMMASDSSIILTTCGVGGGWVESENWAKAIREDLGAKADLWIANGDAAVEVDWFKSGPYTVFDVSATVPAGTWVKVSKSAEGRVNRSPGGDPWAGIHK